MQSSGILTQPLWPLQLVMTVACVLAVGVPFVHRYMSLQSLDLYSIPNSLSSLLDTFSHSSRSVAVTCFTGGLAAP